MNNSNRMSEPATPALQPNYMKIFVQRDYSDGTSVKFQTRFPSELEGRVCLASYLLNHFVFDIITLWLIVFDIFVYSIDWTTHFRINNKSIKRILCWSWKGLMQHLLRGLFGLHHRLFGVHVFRNTLRKGIMSNSNSVESWHSGRRFPSRHINSLVHCIWRDSETIRLSFHLITQLILWFVLSFQCLRKISKYIASQNERIYNPKGLQLTDPTYRGLRVIEISILDRPMRTWLSLSHSTEEFFM